MRPVRITKALATADADGIAQSQTPLAAGNLVLNGALAPATGSPRIAVLDTARQLVFTFAANDVGRVFTVYGFDKPTGGTAISEQVAGSATTSVTTLGFGRVDRITVSAATVGALTVGTNGVGWTSWQQVDWHLSPISVAIDIDVTGTIDYTVQYTDDDIMGSYQGQIFTPGYPTQIVPDATLAGATADGQVVFSDPWNAWRVQINSGSGTIDVTGMQAGMGGI